MHMRMHISLRGNRTRLIRIDRIRFFLQFPLLPLSSFPHLVSLHCTWLGKNGRDCREQTRRSDEDIGRHRADFHSIVLSHLLQCRQRARSERILWKGDHTIRSGAAYGDSRMRCKLRKYSSIGTCFGDAVHSTGRVRKQAQCGHAATNQRPRRLCDSNAEIVSSEYTMTAAADVCTMDSEKKTYWLFCFYFLPTPI